MLKPLGSKYTRMMLADSIKAEYFSFADETTESLLRSVARSGSYKIVPPGTPLFCQSYTGEGKRGYVLEARVLQQMGDSAEVAVTWACEDRRSIFTIADASLVRKVGRRWVLVREIGHSGTITQ